MWVNHNLNNKIKVVAADYPRPFYQHIASKEQYDSISRMPLDRNEIMAEIIENEINNSHDKRNYLFIVGLGHAYKSPALRRSSLLKNGLSAGYILSEKLGKENVFSIFTHTVSVANNGYIFGKIRNGLFDYVFAENGNEKIAFDLKDSPFGKEWFDATELQFDIKAGSFADNFDGYIFLQPVQEEVNNTPLYELYTDDFINEIKKRAKVANKENYKYWGVELKNLDRNELLNNMRKVEGQKRWEDLLKQRYRYIFN